MADENSSYRRPHNVERLCPFASGCSTATTFSSQWARPTVILRLQGHIHLNLVTPHFHFCF